MKLDFMFDTHEPFLEARMPDGYYQIMWRFGRGFTVSGYNGGPFDVGSYMSIYEALDAANDHYNMK